ncbi:MAG TPA: glycoside hydrolase family 18 protein [Thermoanaerobaculia bacterium]|nr:glycoside hydrolase family 18 protein [Thermoanaerobaculia bacterium]
MTRRFLITILLLCGCQTLPPVAPHRQFRIVGYVRGRADINAIGAKKLTHIYYAFAKVSPLGEVWFEDPDAPAHIAQLQALKAVNPDLKVIVSVGGWGADFFSDAAESEDSRCVFATSAVDLIKRYALDGIDLDWEYPGQPGPGIKYRPEDKQNFTLMLKMLRDELDMLSDARGRTGFNRYTLSIASAGGRYFQFTEMDRLHVYLDWINVMTYDLAGGYSRTTGHHTALYRSAAAGQSTASTESFIRQHLDAGIPPRKIVVGVAFYGRGWRGAWGSDGLYRPYDQYESDYPYSKILRQYIGAQGYERRWDDAAHAPYLWNPDVGRFISYDDPQSLADKARFVKKYGLGGVMYWEQSHDPGETLLDALVNGLR